MNSALELNEQIKGDDAKLSSTPTNLVSRGGCAEEEPGRELAAVEPTGGRREASQQRRQHDHDQAHRRAHSCAASLPRGRGNGKEWQTATKLASNVRPFLLARPRHGFT
jgi:hypothetical protein